MTTASGSRALWLFVLLSVVVGAYGSLGEVTTLSYSNISSHLRDGNTWIVALYAPWCGHCVRLLPELEALVRGHPGLVRVAKADADSEQELQLWFDVSAFPTIFHVRTNGATKRVEARLYRGDADLDEILEFVRVGWESERPLGAFSSPMGLFRRSYAVWAHAIMLVYNRAVATAEALGVSPVAVVLSAFVLVLVSTHLVMWKASQYGRASSPKGVAKKKKKNE